MIAQDTTQPSHAVGRHRHGRLISGFSAGLHDVYIEFVQHGSGPFSGICNLNWFQFGDTSSTVAAPTGATATPASGWR